jgi:hypothetical protein
MKHDIFDFSAADMTWADKAVRVAFLVVLIAVLCMDLFVWRI